MLTDVYVVFPRSSVATQECGEFILRKDLTQHCIDECMFKTKDKVQILWEGRSL